MDQRVRERCTAFFYAIIDEMGYQHEWIKLLLSIGIIAYIYPKPWYYVCIELLKTVIDASKQYFILHTLIRSFLISRFRLLGLILSILIPTSLFMFPAIYQMEYIIHYGRFESRLVSLLMCSCGAANWAIAMYQVRSGTTSSYPAFVVVYEALYTGPETIKRLSSYRTLSAYVDLYDTQQNVESADDFAFFITAILTIIALMYENRRNSALDAKAEFPLENQRV